MLWARMLARYREDQQMLEDLVAERDAWRVQQAEYDRLIAEHHQQGEFGHPDDVVRPGW